MTNKGLVKALPSMPMDAAVFDLVTIYFVNIIWSKLEVIDVKFSKDFGVIVQTVTYRLSPNTNIKPARPHSGCQHCLYPIHFISTPSTQDTILIF